MTTPREGSVKRKRKRLPPRFVYIVSRPGNGLVRVSYTKPTIFIGETCTKYARVDFVRTWAS